MPRAPPVGKLTKETKKSLKDRLATARLSRWSNKENISPAPQPTPDPPATPQTDWKSKFLGLFTRHKSTQRALQRERKKSAKHAARAEGAGAKGHGTREATGLVIRTLQSQNKELTFAKTHAEGRITALIAKKRISERTTHAMKEKIRRFTRTLGRAVEKAKRSYVVRLKKKGYYTSQARRLARTLVHAGCAPRKVARVINEVSGVMGVRVIGNMSARTVGRTQLEGLVASDMQSGYELAAANAVTISQDSTSNRHVNYESHHFATQVPDYSKGETLPSATSEHKVRLLRVESTLDHSSEKSRDAWLEQLEAIGETYNESPLAQRSGVRKFSMRHFALILKGMHGDHASSEKGSVKLMGEWKHEETLVDLGEKRLLETSDIAGLLLFLNEKKAAYIQKLGGTSVWDGLSPTERSRHEEKLTHAIKVEVGNDVYKSLSDFDRRMLDFPFTEEDEAYLRRKAREWDAQGKERERKRLLREHGEKVVAEKREKDAKKIKKADDRRSRLLKVVISSCGANLAAMIVPQLDDQLDALKEIYGDTEIPNKSSRGKKAEKVKHLEDAIARFDARRPLIQDIVEENLAMIVTSWDEEDELEYEMEEDDTD